MIEGVKCMCGVCKQKPCNVCNVYNNKDKQEGWVIHLLSEFYSPCHDVFPAFRLFQGFERGGCLPQVYSRAQICIYMLFLPETIFNFVVTLVRSSTEHGVNKALLPHI